MHKLDPIESALARLMPPAMSAAGQRSIEDMLDELAGASAAPVLRSLPASPGLRRLLTAGIAATGVAAALVFPLARPPALTSWAAQSVTAKAAAANSRPAGMVLVGESDRVEAMTDAGWQEDADGAPMQ